MQISKVSLLSKGTKGIRVIYLKPEKRGSSTFNHEYDVKYKVPVTPEIRKSLMDMEPYAKEMLCLKEDSEINVISVVSNEVNIQLEVEVFTFDQQVFPVTSTILKEATEYKGYDALKLLVEKLYDSVTTYVTKKVTPEAHQMLMDFVEYGPEKKVKKIMQDVEGNTIDIESLSKEEQQAKAIEICEQMGCLVMKPEEFTADTSVN